MFNFFVNTALQNKYVLIGVQAILILFLTFKPIKG